MGSSGKASEIKLQVPHMRICRKLGSTVGWMVDLSSPPELLLFIFFIFLLSFWFLFLFFLLLLLFQFALLGEDSVLECVPRNNAESKFKPRLSGLSIRRTIAGAVSAG